MNSDNPAIITALTACILRLKWHEQHLTSFPLDVAARNRAELALKNAELPREHRPILTRYFSRTNTKPCRIKAWVKDHPAGARFYSADSFDTALGQHTYHEAAKRYAAEIHWPKPAGHVVYLDNRNAAVI